MKDQEGGPSSPVRRLRLLMIEDDVTDVELVLHVLKRGA